MEEKGLDIKSRNFDENTPLLLAAHQNTNIEIIKYLLEKNSDINAKNKKNSTVLHLASERNKNLDILKLLEERCNLDVNYRNKNGNSAVHYAWLFYIIFFFIFII